MTQAPRDEGGLDYLVKAGKLRGIGPDEAPPEPSDSATQSAAPNVDRRLEAFAARVVLTAVKEIEATPEHGAGARLSEVAEHVGMAGDVLIPLSRRLANAGAIRILETDAFGNQLVSLTEEGQRLLDPSAASELIERIAAG